MFTRNSIDQYEINEIVNNETTEYLTIGKLKCNNAKYGGKFNYFLVKVILSIRHNAEEGFFLTMGFSCFSTIHYFQLICCSQFQINFLLRKTNIRLATIVIFPGHHIGGVMVSVRLESGRSWVRVPIGLKKDYKMGMCCFSAKHETLRRKNKDWLARNQDNVHVPSVDCCFSELAL